MPIKRQERKSVSRQALAAQVGERINSARKQKGFTLQELAAKSDVGYGTLVSYEKGEAEPSALKLVQIARALEVPLLSLFSEVFEGVRETSPAWGADPLAADLLAAWASIKDPARREQAYRFVLFLREEEKREGTKGGGPT